MQTKNNKKQYTFSEVMTRFGQFLYLTIHSFNQNNMWESASSCSFGFIFSFVPIIMIISTVLIGILKVSPGVLDYVYQFAESISDIINIKPFISNLITNKNLRLADIFLGIWVIWMARKLFNSIVQAVNRIFRKISKRKGWLNQIITFISELVLVLLFVVIILAAFVFSKLRSLPIFEYIKNSAPVLISAGSNMIFNGIVYFLLFISATLTYKYVSGTNPKFSKCFFYAALNTAAFFVLSIFLNRFFDTSKYNVIYGTISTLIILMAKVYFFFVIFLFCAQMIYVSQFFEILLRSELYLRPETAIKDVKGSTNKLKSFLFSNPSILQNKQNTVKFSLGNKIYKKGDKSDSVYFIISGIVSETSETQNHSYQKGNFFGDVQCILNQDRQSDAVAMNDCELLVFSVEDFTSLLHENPKASAKALSKVSDYTAKIYEEKLQEQEEESIFHIFRNQQ